VPEIRTTLNRRWFAYSSLLILISTGSCVSSLAQSVPSATSAQSDQSIYPQALLIRSYVASQQLVPEERAMALVFLARSAGSIEPAYNRLWSEELFFYAFRLPRNWNRLAFEKNALESLAASDPERAMQLFGQMEDPIPQDSGRFPEDLRAFAARTIFPAFWKFKGLQGFDEIRARAQLLGSTGQYPYVGIAPLVRELADSEDPRAEVMLGDAVSHFSQGSRFDSAAKEYVELLNEVWSILSAPLKRQAITAAVTQLTQPPTAGDFIYRGTARTKSNVVEFTNQNQQLLFELIPRIREVDPQLADRLLEKNPSFAAAENTQSTEGGMITNVSAASPAQVAEAQSRLGQSQILARVENETGTNPALALSDAQSLTRPDFRALALAKIAARLAATDPARASELLGQASDSTKGLKDSEEKVVALFARAKASYALHDRASMQATWTHALELGEELFQEDLEAHPSMQAYQATCFDALTEGVKFGADADPEMALGALRTVRNELLQTYLPIAAAEGIYSHSQLRR
jgi:hypothetical protein